MDDLIKASANKYIANGYSVIPIASHKKPAIRWKQYQDEIMNPEEWDFKGCNIAVITGEVSGIVIVDCDSVDSYAGWLSHRPHTPMRVKSRRGMHFWYRHPGEYIMSDSHIKAAEGFEYDVKGDRSYALAPPSLSNGFQYHVCVCKGNIHGRLLDREELPVFDPSWRPERIPPEREDSRWSTQEIKDVRAYISQIFAISGNGGDKNTYTVACRLAETCQDKIEAMGLFVEWNARNATPPWTIEDLHRKLKLAYGDSRCEK